MNPPARLLEEADLLAFVPVPDSAHFTGRLQLYSGDQRVGRVPHLAICRPHDGTGLLLLHCDESWSIVGIQAWNAPGVEPVRTVEAMMEKAERYYAGLSEHWKIVGERK
jgi:hypothetical protein